MVHFYSLYFAIPIIYIPLFVSSFVFGIPALNFASANICLYHICGLINMVDINKHSKSMTINPIYIIVNFVYLYSDMLKLIAHNISYLIFAILYQELVFKKYICSASDCVTIDHIYESGIVIHSITCIMMFTVIVFYIYTFVSKRLNQWSKIVDLSNILFKNKSVYDNFSCMVGIHDYIQNFTNEWLNKDATYMEEECNKNANNILNIFNTHLLDRSLESVENHANEIYRDDIMLKSSKLGYVDENHVGIIWDMASADNVISKKSVYQLLLSLYYERRLFASEIETDKKVVNWIVTFFALFFYGLGAVFVVDIFNYNEAFGSGIDVFKLYLALSTYLVGVFHDRLHFMFVMIYTRPYNINDIIRIGDNLWQVKDISVRDTTLQGNNYMILPNTLMYKNGIINYTKGFVRDHIAITVPISYYNADNKIYSLLEQYHIDHPNEITNMAITYDIISESCCVLRCIFNYTNRIYSINIHNTIRASLASFLYKGIQMDIERNLIEILSAHGGAYNDWVSKSKFE